MYIGYWIIESGVPHDFDNVDTTIFEIVKENIITVLKATVHQRTLEAIVRKDLFTGLNTGEYLYGEGKKLIDKYTMSAVCMFKITNIVEINERHSRELGNKVITEVAKYVQDNISEEYVFVRYMGPKFAIVFSGVEVENVVTFLEDIKETLENTAITIEEKLQVRDIKSQEIEEIKQKIKKTKAERRQTARPKLNFVVSRYYKGTGLEELTKNLEGYLDNADPNEHAISTM